MSTETTFKVVPVDSVPKASGGRPRKSVYDDLMRTAAQNPGQWFSISGLSRNQAAHAMNVLRKAGFLAKQRQNAEDKSLSIYAQHPGA